MSILKFTTKEKGRLSASSDNQATSKFQRTLQSTNRGSTANAQATQVRFKQMALVVAASVAIAFIAICLAFWQMTTSRASVESATSGASGVLVAKSNIKAGDTLDDSSVEVRQIPAAWKSNSALDASALSGQDSVIGKRALVDISQGSQLSLSYLLSKNTDERLSSGIDDTCEAVSLSVDSETGLAGKISTFDNVRIISVGADSSGVVSAQVLCECASVLALGGEQTSDGAAYSALVVQVTPDQALKIREAQVQGKISVQLLPASLSLASGDHNG